jgi:outer membrane receptor protein involved in Fe transport
MTINHRHITATVAFVSNLLLTTAAHAQPPAAPAQDPSQDQQKPPAVEVTVQVTATRFGEPVQGVPGSISIVTAEEIRARGATDLRTALALLGGVSVAPGGDAGPAGAVPGLIGVREVDDLLVLIDGIPAGGAFIPQVEAISLNNVERIEVLRGAAPVYYGTTAFAGTINVIHYPAGNADPATAFRYGSYQSGGAGGAAVLSAGSVRQSISAEATDDELSDKRAGYKRFDGTWRLATHVHGANLHADADLLALRQKPNSPMPIDEATGRLTTRLPVDFNQNPANAKLDSDRYKLVVGYDVPLSFGHWGNTAAYTDTRTDSIRGFLDIGDTPQPWTPKTNADLESFTQSLRLREMFVDSNLTTQIGSRLDVTAGVNLLVGRASADSVRYGLRLLLDGVSQAGEINSVNPKGTVALDDRRNFWGLYAQSRYQLSSRASLLVGLRWNDTHEGRDEVRVNSRGVVTSTPATQDVDRVSGSIGAGYKAWESPSAPIGEVTLHASAGYTFQPAQIEFGPNPEARPEGGGLLTPETQRSVVMGLRADTPGGKVSFDVDGFFVDFYNQPVNASSGGIAVLRSIGHQRYKGLNVEGSVRPTKALTAKASVTWSDARYRDFLTEIDGVATQLAGRHQVLTPTASANGGLVYAAGHGWRGSITTSWIGTHWLNSLNTFEAPAYAIVDASLGYRFEKFTVSILANNLGNRRDPVQLSELGEGQFYVMPARRINATVSWQYKSGTR